MIRTQPEGRDPRIVAEQPLVSRLLRAGVELKPCSVMTVGDHETCARTVAEAIRAEDCFAPTSSGQ